MDAIVALASGTVSTWSDTAAVVRFNPNGQLDVRDGGTFAAEAAVPYTAGQTYAFRMVVDVPAKRYDVFVTLPDGSTVQLANDYRFRTEQQGIATINSWGARVAPTIAPNATLRLSSIEVQSQ
jgi:hypothetical protein